MSETEHSRTPRPRRRKRRGSDVVGTILKVLGTLVLIGVITCAILACFATVYIRTIIMPQAGIRLTEYNSKLSSHLYYTDPETGARTEMRTLYGDENRVWVSYDEIPEDLVNAAIAIEDKTFRTNNGVNWKRTAGAFLNMFLKMRDTFGGSTITQQVVKNTTGDNEGTVKRKIMEIFRALELNNNYSKETIMEHYLNLIFLGERCNGVYTASYTYFGKNVSDLTLAECASLIGITNNPSLYDPYLSLETTDPETGAVRTNRDRNKERQEIILKEMKKQGLITQEEYDAAVAQELVFQRGSAGETPKSGAYTWYEDQVIREVVADLREQYHLSEKAAYLMLYNGGLEVETCLNPKIQAMVDEVYGNRENLNKISARGQQLQSAITIVDNETGNIVALSGGIGEKTGSLWHNRATAVRQPGSSIKPVGVYAPAIELGMINPATVIDDAPINLNGSAWPRNSYGHYKGRMTVFEALQRSANTVPVRVLRDYITPQVAYDFMSGKLGFTTLVAAREGKNGKVYSDIDLSPLSLGGLTDGVTTREMAAAYSAFARMGIYIEPRTYTRVYDSNGTIVLDNEAEQTVAMKESTAYYINYMLKNAAAVGTGYEGRFSGMTIAGKTGTTTNNYDRWFVGYTPYYTAAVWTGYDENERLSNISGNPSAQLWKKVMSQVHEGLENKDFSQPAEGAVSRQYCLDSGMLPNDYCPIDARGSRVKSGAFVSGDAPTQYCTLHVPVEVCKEDPILGSDGQPTGLYRLAGEFCPAESRTTVGVLDYNRNTEGLTYTCKDDEIMKANLEAMGTCQVHTAAPPEPSTEPWPTDVPWPTDLPWSTPDPNASYEPWPSDQPSAEPSGEPGVPTLPPVPVPTSSEEPDYVPVSQ